jgi:hypothetical protein
MIAYEFQHKLIVAPIYVLILAIALMVLMKKPSLKGQVGGFLFIAGVGEILLLSVWTFLEGFFLGLVTGIIGFVIILLRHRGFLENRLKLPKVSIIKKIVYAVLAVTIVSSGLVLSVRATTNLLREDHIANYHGSSSSNLSFRGVITGISLNYEEQIYGCVYHVFQARVALNVTEFVWGGGMWENQTTSADYWLNQGIVHIYYDKSDVSKLAVGQTVEFKGCYCPWFEDSLYSEMLVVDPKISDSYINPL